MTGRAQRWDPVLPEPRQQAIGRGRVLRREQPGRGQHVVGVDDDPRRSRHQPTAVDVVTGAGRQDRHRVVGRVVPQHSAGADEQVDLAQVLAVALDESTVRAEHHLLATGVPTYGEVHRRRGDREVVLVSCRLRRAPGSGRVPAPAASTSPSGTSRPASAAASTVGTALHRMPRSPSTVRLTGTVATTSRPARRSSGSTSTTECTSVVAPPTSTTTTSPAPGCSAPRPDASSSTAVSTMSGVAPCTIAVKSARLRQVLAADHVAEEHLADRRPRTLGAQHADLGNDVVGDDVRDTGPREQRRRSRPTASALPATTTGPDQRGVGQRLGVARAAPRRCRRRCRRRAARRPARPPAAHGGRRRRTTRARPVRRSTAPPDDPPRP